MSGYEIDGKTIGIWDGYITIVLDKGDEVLSKRIIVTAQGQPSDKFISLDDCLSVIGYDGNGFVTVIMDEALCGEIYRYGNYVNKCWIKCGTTTGYA